MVDDCLAGVTAWTPGQQISQRGYLTIRGNSPALTFAGRSRMRGGL